MNTELVSVIIPAYNAEKYIRETIYSVIYQTYPHIELIIVNDTSTDNTLALIQATIIDHKGNSRIFSNEKNSGVSASRNVGLKLAKGEYVVFLDADDLLPENFIENRVAYLKVEKKDACSSIAYTIDTFGTIDLNTKLKGASEKIDAEVLLYKIDIITCPSNYMFRRGKLLENNIFFNEKLSSSADRYFLLECNKFLLFGHLDDSPFYYRIDNNSMSHKLSNKLLIDNLEYAKLLIVNNLLPANLRKEFLKKIYYHLFAGFFKIGYYSKACLFFLKLHSVAPLFLAKKTIGYVRN